MAENPFDLFTEEYEAWFRENENTFQSELLALRQVVPIGKKGVEIGIGSGIFAEKLGIQSGIDPSEKMLSIACERGRDVVNGVAENLPYPEASFDFAVFITSICFVDDPEKAMMEARRVLKPHREIIIAFIDQDSVLGKYLEKEKGKSKFYKHASFFSVTEIINHLEVVRFNVTSIFQTLENPGNKEIEQPMEGYGKGSFVVIKGKKYSYRQRLI